MSMQLTWKALADQPQRAGVDSGFQGNDTAKGIKGEMSDDDAQDRPPMTREAAGGARRGDAATLGAADWLCLAAAPTFAMMTMLTGVFGRGSQAPFCAAAQDASPLTGMVPMYLLMSAFHSAPWLKLISSRRSDVRRS